MRALLLTLGLLSVIPGLAHAGDADDEEELLLFHGLPTLRAWWLDINTSGTVGHSASREVMARSEVAVKGQARWEHDDNVLLPLVHADGQFFLGTGSDAGGLGASLQGQARVVDLAIEVEGLRLRFGPYDFHGAYEWQMRPSLSRRRDLWARPYSRWALGGSVWGFGLGNFQIVRVGYEEAFLEQRDVSASLSRSQYSIDIDMLSWGRKRHGGGPDLKVDLIAFHTAGTVVHGGADTLLSRVDILRFAGLGKGAYLDLALGYDIAGGILRIGEEGEETVIEHENLPELSVPVARARLHGGGTRALVVLEASRSMYLTVDMELAIEERIAAEAQWRRRRGELLLRAFAASTELWLDKETSESLHSGGVYAGWRHALPHDISLLTSVEVARSFYTSLEGDARPRSELGVQAMATLTRHIGPSWSTRPLGR